ncbi:hypothetical protein DN604_00295 [Aeromonas caviae]|nr:hypothetical protein DN604_00295 [Aeromonas caviae]
MNADDLTHPFFKKNDIHFCICSTLIYRCTIDERPAIRIRSSGIKFTELADKTSPRLGKYAVTQIRIVLSHGVIASQQMQPDPRKSLTCHYMCILFGNFAVFGTINQDSLGCFLCHSGLSSVVLTNHIELLWAHQLRFCFLHILSIQSIIKTLQKNQ